VVASAFIKQRYMSTQHTETKTGIQHLTERVSWRRRRDCVWIQTAHAWRSLSCLPNSVLFSQALPIG